jgi:predicted acylesterase/phospholipase RssA
MARQRKADQGRGSRDEPEELRQAEPTNGTKRAICLAGGGPAAGLHIGVLEGLQENGIKFDSKDDVWALSCIGAWVGVVYNQAEEENEIEETYSFFRKVFRDDETFKSFPVNRLFGPDWAGNAEAMKNFLFEPNNYKNLFLPRQVMQSLAHMMSLLSRKRKRRKWDEGDINDFLFNHIMAVNPVVRFWMALMFKSEIDGLARIHYPNSRFMKSIEFKNLKEPGKPYIFHNAWNLSTQDLELFSNKPVFDRAGARKPYGEISAASLCACSALPFVEQTVKIGNHVYCEGALVDTVNFEKLLEDHPSLEEIWISRIVDGDQIRPPKNLHDSLANLCQLFAATVGEDDVKLFKYHVGERNRSRDKSKMWTGTIIEIEVNSDINFEWSYNNLEVGREKGREAGREAYARYHKKMEELKNGKRDPHNAVIIEAKNREQRRAERRQRLGLA